MHIAEGFLPHPWWEIWFGLSIPVVAYGIWKLKKAIREDPALKPTLALAGAFAFVLSALKIPSVTGSCSHPTGTGFGAILFGPAITSVLGFIVLLFQALLLAHGGITTLGANTFSMGIVDPVIAWFVYMACIKSRMNFYASVFLASFLGDIATYVTTSIQLALAFPAATGGVLASFKLFFAIFAVTQLPLAIIEGIVTASLFKYMKKMRPDILIKLKVIEAPAAEGGAQ
jgi:cobalt/nickel transport system permease protein